MNKILSGKFSNGLINGRLQIVTVKDVFQLSPDTVSGIDVMSSDNTKSFGSAISRGVVGSVLGPIGMLGGVLSAKNKNTYMIKIYYKDGETSIAAVKDKLFKKLQIEFM